MTTPHVPSNSSEHTASSRPAPESVSERPAETAPTGAFAAKDRLLLFALLGVLVLAFALVGSNVAANHAPKPHQLPLGVIGTPLVVSAEAASLEHRAPGAFQIHAYSSLAAAKEAILHRDVYGALQPASTPLLLVASAASPAVEALLQKTFTAAAQKQGKTLVVRDLVPLPSSDSRGATTFSMLISLLVIAIISSAIIYLLGRHRPPPVRLAAMVAMGVCAGLVAALLTTVIIGAFHGHFLAVWGVATLFVLAVGLPIAAFQVFVGASGIAIGALMFLVIGNPASGGSSAPELLPGFWRALSQLLPPGAAMTAMRDVVYFHGHGMTHALLVLSIYAILGATTVFTLQILRTPTRTARAGLSTATRQ